MTVLVMGSSPSDFTGWGGAGSPVYSSTANMTSGYPYWMYTNMGGALPIGDNGWGRGCLWKDWEATANEFSLMVVFGLYGGDESGTISTAPVVIHTKSGTAWLVLRYVNDNTTAWTGSISWYLTTDLSDNSKYTRLFSGSMTPPDTYARACVFVINVKGAGTSSGRIDCYSDVISTGLPPGTVMGSWTGDLTDYHDFNAVSIHSPTTVSGSDGYINFVRVYADTVSCRGVQVYETYSTTVSATFSDWTGPFSQSSTTVVNYETYGSGLYANTVGDKKTFIPGNETPLPLSGYEIRSVSLRASISGGMNTPTAVSGYIYNPSTKLSINGDAVYTCTPEGGMLVQHWYQDPLTAAAWTATDYATYEFGVIRTE